MIGLKLANGTLHTVFDSDYKDSQLLTLSPATPGAHPIGVNLYRFSDDEEILAQHLGTLRIDGSGGDIECKVDQDSTGKITIHLRDPETGVKVEEHFDPDDQNDNLFQFSDNSKEWQSEQIDLADNYEIDKNNNEDQQNIFFDDQDDIDDDIDDASDDEDDADQSTTQKPGRSYWIIGGLTFLVLAACFAGAYMVFLLLKSPPYPLLEFIP